MHNGSLHALFGKLTIVGVITILLFWLSKALFIHYFDKRTTLVFCDVGQGDGAYIRLNNRIDILVDAGAKSKILECLGTHMPFYDRTIEMAFVSHPQLDHFGGLIPTLNRYKIITIYTNPLKNLTKEYKELILLARQKNTTMKPLHKGAKIKISDAHIETLWPTSQYIADAPSSTDPNDFSQVLIFSQRGKKVLFTGDASTYVLEHFVNLNTNRVDILKVPHHCSRTGISDALLQLADPTVAVISAGKDNTYGHPANEVLSKLHNAGVVIKRTDQDGSIVYRW